MANQIVNGSCFCGEVKFEVSGDRSPWAIATAGPAVIGQRVR